MKIIKIIMVAVVWIASALGRFTPASTTYTSHISLLVVFRRLYVTSFIDVCNLQIFVLIIINQ